MRPLVLILSVLIVISCFFTFNGITTDITVTWQRFEPNSENHTISQSSYFPVQFPVTLRSTTPQSLLGTFHTKGNFVTGKLVFSATGGPVTLLYGEYTETFHQKNSKCSVLSSTTYSCQTLLSFSAEDAAQVYLFTENEQSATVNSAYFDVAKLKRHNVLSGNIFFAFIILLASFGPLFRYVQRWPIVNNIILISISTSFCIFLNTMCFIIIALFLIISYVLTKRLCLNHHNKSLLFSVIIISIVFLLFVKNFLPEIGYLFADPGRFYFLLPLGFSYFIIKLIDITISAYSGSIDKMSLLDFLSFMLFPATLAAGPIFTWDSYRKSQVPDYNITFYGSGLARVSFGILKKLIADTYVYPYVLNLSNAFILFPYDMESTTVLSFLVANTLFVYLDFSAYSDMAIGTGRSMGYNIPENFSFPLLKPQLRIFWQSWHMTLSNWVMRRVYMASIVSSRSIPLSTFCSMLTIGLWHSFNLSWTFWALHHSAFLTIEKPLWAKLGSFIGGKKTRDFPNGNLAATILGIFLVWFWVSLGHSFTMFCNINLAIQAYWLALQAPVYAIRNLFMILF